MGILDVVDRLLAHYRRRRAMERFMRETAGILKTPRIEITPGPPRIVSRISRRHIQMYLIAIKAFLTRFGRGELVCIIDADTPEKDKATLKQHLSGIRFQILETIDPSPCQRGGTWERLVYVLEQSQDMYTIQIDSDCLAFGDIREVSECVDANRSFALSGSGGRPILTMREWAAKARQVDSNYVGIRAERLFDRVPGCDELKYVRASSGFCGFARGGFPRERLDAFHETMASLMGGAWHEWGTEQNGSNFAIANSKDAVLLPFPKYANFTPWHDPNLSQFLHFFGTYRFVNDVFLQRSLQVISELGGGSAAGAGCATTGAGGPRGLPLDRPDHARNDRAGPGPDPHGSGPASIDQSPGPAAGAGRAPARHPPDPQPAGSGQRRDDRRGPRR